MARAPIEPMIVRPVGEYGIERPQSPSGSDNEYFRAGKHLALDLHGDRGTKVYAPADSTVVAIWRNNDTPGWRGLGPVGVLLDTHDGFYSLLAHLQYQYWESHGYKNIGERFKEGELVGVTSGLDHCHWQTNNQKKRNSQGTWEGISINPRLWLSKRSKAEEALKTGIGLPTSEEELATLGVVSIAALTLRHVMKIV